MKRFIVKEEFHSFHQAMWYRIHDTEKNISCPWYPSRRKAVAEALKLNRADVSAKKIEATIQVRERVRARLAKLADMPRRRFKTDFLWKWDVSSRVFRARGVDADLDVQWHKVGGRGSKGQGLSYWTFHVYFDQSTEGGHREQFKSAREAKAAAEQAVRDYRLRCPDCGGSIADHNSLNRVEAGWIAHSRTGGACWKSLNSPFVSALARARGHVPKESDAPGEGHKKI